VIDKKMKNIVGEESDKIFARANISIGGELYLTGING
jgi:hypothetical protein